MDGWRMQPSIAAVSCFDIDGSAFAGLKYSELFLTLQLFNTILTLQRGRFIDALH
jgi:hypothetical protein